MPDYTRQARYDAVNTVRINVKLNRKTDADILAALEAAESKNGLIRQAIREYIKKASGPI